VETLEELQEMYGKRAMDIVQPAGTYQAWLDAADPIHALLTWSDVQLTAHGTSGSHGQVNRHSRANAINARKRAIESHTWTDTDGRKVRVKLTLTGRSYSESYGFMHASYFDYSVTRTVEES
jgi:hypothetical protein